MNTSLADSRTALLTTYRKTGAPVATPVSVKVNGDRVYFTTAADSGKARRLVHDPRVTLAPCAVQGKVLGPAVAGRASVIEVRGGRPVGGLLRPTQPVFWSYLGYRLRRKKMRFYEVVLDSPASAG